MCASPLVHIATQDSKRRCTTSEGAEETSPNTTMISQNLNDPVLEVREYHGPRNDSQIICRGSIHVIVIVTWQHK